MKGDELMKFTKKDERSDLRKEYDNAVLVLKTCIPGSDAYETQLKIVERLHKLLMEEYEHHIEADHVKEAKLSNMLSCATNLTGIGIIVGYEHLHNITSKALGFVLKGRLR